MKLQTALDFSFTAETAVALLERIRDSIDVIEVGTPFVMEEGLRPVKTIKEKFPDKQILADLKIVDAGSYEAEAAFRNGADIVTVLAVADDLTIQNACEAAKRYGKEILIDMLAVPDLKERISQIDAMQVDYICFHTSKDLQKINQNAAEAFRMLKKSVKNAKLALAGGICEDNIETYAAIKPDLIIVGEGISAAKNPQKAAETIKRAMIRYE